MTDKCFDKKSNGTDAAMLADTPNQQLANELHKPIIGEFQKRAGLLILLICN